MLFMCLTWGSEFAFSFFFWLKTFADQYLLRVPLTDTVFICPLVAEPLVHCQCSGTFFGCCGQEQRSEDTANQKAHRAMNLVSPWPVPRNSEHLGGGTRGFLGTSGCSSEPDSQGSSEFGLSGQHIEQRSKSSHEIQQQLKKKDWRSLLGSRWSVFRISCLNSKLLSRKKIANAELD